jgi:HAMP domain-containing protein
MAYLLALPFVAAVAAAGAWWMAGRLTDPLIRVANAAEGMDARTLNERLPEPRGADEISRLTRVLNSLFERLERVRASQSLRCRRLTRITRLRSCAVVLRVDQADPSGRDAPLLVSLLEENQRLAAIADKLLFQRADAGKFSLAGKCKPHELIQEISRFLVSADAKGVRLRTKLIWIFRDREGPCSGNCFSIFSTNEP